MRLYQRDTELSIRVDRHELMNSRVYAPEDALSKLGCERIKERPGARVLIGGLGMGYSLRTALLALRADAQVIVAELVPAVVKWNREHFGHLADHPLRDPRVTVRQEDVGRVIRSARSDYDAMLLDVDNGPDGLTRKSNDGLYTRPALRAARAALRPGGVLGIWSCGQDNAFVRRLRESNFDVEEVLVGARGKGKGARHTLWFAVPRS